MPLKQTQVHRDQLYEEVWSAPVTHVAKAYGVSDVGLRKICQKLGVPTPEPGYWAKRSYGKAPKQTPLPKHVGPVVHVISRRIDDDEDELRRRVASAKASQELPQPAAEAQSLELQLAPSAWHPSVKRTARAVRGSSSNRRDGWRSAEGPGVFAVFAFKDNLALALALMDLSVRACEAAGIVVLDGGLDKPARVTCGRYEYTFRIAERPLRQERPLTQPKSRTLAYFSNSIIRPKYDLLPTGTFTFELQLLGHHSKAILTRADTKRRQLKIVLQGLPALLRNDSLERAARSDLAAERAERLANERRRREELLAIRAAEMKRLEHMEKEAAQWRRARALDAYADALDERAHRHDQSPDERARLLESARWAHHAAAWLDPLRRRPWPEVDDAPATHFPWLY